MISVKAVKIGDFLISTKIDNECKGLFERHDHVAFVPSSDKDFSFQFEEESNTAILEDWKTYFIQSSNGSLSEALLDKRGEFISPYLSKIQFNNSIGKSRLGDFIFDVKSRKLSDDEFRLMLEYVEKHACNLSLAKSQSKVGYKASRDKLFFNTNPYLKLKYLIGFYFKDLQPWLKIIAKNPHRLSTEIRYFEEVEQIHDFDELAMLEVFSGSSNYVPTTIKSDLSNAIVFNGIRHLPEEINQGEVVDTYNTPENQFVKYFIDSLVQLIKKHGDCFDFATDAMLPRSELAKIRKELQFYSGQSVLRECTQMKQIPFSSQVLIRDLKYKKVLEFYKRIHSVPTLNFSDTPFEEIMELKNIDRLYEYYCFFKLDDIITGLLPSFTINRKIELVDNGFEKSLSNSFIEYNDDHLRFHLHFKKKYPSGESYSVDLEPDFSVEIENLHTNQLLKVFFDAKFKFKDGYVNSEDIHKMHTYKDAIDGFSAIVLYPGEHNHFYKDSAGKSDLEGVGCFVLKPGTIDKQISDYINSLIS